MATQKPGEWANSLLARFEDQVIGKNANFYHGTSQNGKVKNAKKIEIFFGQYRCIDWKNCVNEIGGVCEWDERFVIVLRSCYFALCICLRFV